MNRPTAFLALTCLFVPLVLAAPRRADAQLSGSSTAPVDITADHTEFQANQCMSRWSGNAEALQETSRLRANTIDVFGKVLGGARTATSGPNCGETDHMVADGEVYYVTPTQIVKGDRAVYTADAKTIVFTGQVVVAQGKNVIAGTRLLIHTDTHEATMEAGATGRGQPDRVRAVLYPKSTPGAAGDTGGLQPPTPPPPRRHGA